MWHENNAFFVLQLFVEVGITRKGQLLLITREHTNLKPLLFIWVETEPTGTQEKNWSYPQKCGCDCWLIAFLSFSLRQAMYVLLVLEMADIFPQQGHNFFLYNWLLICVLELDSQVLLKWGSTEVGITKGSDCKTFYQ